MPFLQSTSFIALHLFSCGPEANRKTKGLEGYSLSECPFNHYTPRHVSIRQAVRESVCFALFGTFDGTNALHACMDTRTRNKQHTKKMDQHLIHLRTRRVHPRWVMFSFRPLFLSSCIDIDHVLSRSTTQRKNNNNKKKPGGGQDPSHLMHTIIFLSSSFSLSLLRLQVE